MKKLKLSALQLSAKDVLTREQLKKIYGSSGDYGSGGSGGSGHSCCISVLISGSGGPELWMALTPITVNSQTECAQAAAAKVGTTMGKYPRATYDTDCDGV